MLPKKHRLSKAVDVKKTTAKGRSFFNPNFVLKSVSGGTEPKFTIITSVRSSKLAVLRNRAKRIIRDELRKQINDIKPGNYVIIVRSAATKVDSAELRTNLNNTLKKISIK